METFPKLEGGKHQVGSDAEVRISIKGEKDQSKRNLWRDIISELKRAFADSAWMRSLVSFLRLMEEVRNIPWLHSIINRYSDQI